VPERNLVIVRRGYDAGAGFRLTPFLTDVIEALE
jgi:hypothetical protein